jgi:alpha-mannosidase
MPFGEEILRRKIHARRNEIQNYIITNTTPITDIVFREAEGYESYEQGVQGEFRPIKVGDTWGGNKNAWFKLRFSVPDDWKGQKVFALFDCGGEACAYIDGKPFHGLDRNHQEMLLTPDATGGEAFEIIIDAITGAAWGEDSADGHFVKLGSPVGLERAELAVKNAEVEEYFYSLTVLTQLIDHLPSDSPRRAKLIHVLSKSVDAFDYTHLDASSLKESALAANEILQPLLDCKAEDSSLTMSMIGHSHIDAAWLWPFKETRRKCSRTFSTQLRLMEQYPEYIYTQGQALLYQFVKEDHPELYKEIKQRAAEGRWDVTGSMWVEADCNLSSGESLVRQVLIGKNFFKDEFGVDTDVLWLPDVFGYSAALPQILSKAGVKYFLTSKIYWSDTNQPTYGTFHWKGIDGSRVLTHFPPSGDYSGFPDPQGILDRSRRWPEKDRANEILFTFGHGDGGGGPASTHMEHLRREWDLEGLPRCELKSVPDFFHSIDNGAEYREWVGELYLEYHRGTYTIQARNKRHNRKAELLYREAEILSVLAAQSGMEYPYEELNHQWKEILACQFHDVIPGTSIRTVYEETEATYAKIFEAGEQICKDALSAIVETTDEDKVITVFNSLPWERTDIVTIPRPDDGQPYTVFEASGAETDSQLSDTEIQFSATAPAMGYATYCLSNYAPLPIEPEITVSETHLENRYFRIELDKDGLLTSVIHKETGRETLLEGQRGNLLRIYEDKPIGWPAWDIDFFYSEKYEDVTDLESIRVIDAGFVSGAVEMTRTYGESRIKQRIVIYADTPRIDFETWVDWHEKHKLLKVVFPVDVNTDKARYDIQFGNIERPTHTNTSWDFAKFEVCAHKWADISEGNFGVSLMNDCKYGYSVRGSVMQLSLLRSQKEPDPQADMGEHEFTYSLMPHSGGYIEAETVRLAYELNAPLRVMRGGSVDDPVRSFVSVDAPNVILETVKRAEKEDAVILRLYECHNSRAKATVKIDLPFAKAYECGIMEDNLAEIAVHQPEHQLDDRTITLDMRPFEIKTVKLVVSA